MTQAQQQTQQQTVSPEEAQARNEKWAQEQLVKIQKQCFANGIEFNKFKADKCLSLPPAIGIWAFTDNKKNEYWAITGQLPVDIAPASVAANQREVARYFSMSWQLKAARMEESLAEGKMLMGDAETQKAAIDELIQKANALYDIYEKDDLWRSAKL